MLREQASARGLELSETPEFRFRRHYNLPPTDPRFLDATIEDIVVDLWAHAHTDDPNLRNEVKDPHFDEELAAMEAEFAAPAAEAPKPAQVLGSDDWEEVFEDRYPS